MKSYGHTRSDKQCCKYGCCARHKGNFKADGRYIYDRRAAKRARFQAKRECVTVEKCNGR